MDPDWSPATLTKATSCLLCRALFFPSMVLVSWYLLSQPGFGLHPESSLHLIFFANSSIDVKDARLFITSIRPQWASLTKGSASRQPLTETWTETIVWKSFENRLTTVSMYGVSRVARVVLGYFKSSLSDWRCPSAEEQRFQVGITALTVDFSHILLLLLPPSYHIHI